LKNYFHVQGGKAPSPNIQAPEKFQHSSSKARTAVPWCLELGASLVLGAWILELFIELGVDAWNFISASSF
jgi:hypothetical protein